MSALWHAIFGVREVDYSLEDEDVSIHHDADYSLCISFRSLFPSKWALSPLVTPRSIIEVPQSPWTAARCN